MRSILVLSIAGALLLARCAPGEPSTRPIAGVGQGATGDANALALADSVIAAMGGAQAWADVPFVAFNFLGRRSWLWDKHGGRYRVESEQRGFRIAGTLDGSSTNLWLNGQVVTQPDSLAKYAKYAYEAWINDTYWLVMPFKVKDAGVRLDYAGSCRADSITPAVCLDMTFNAVGVTPENRYTVYVDTTTYRVIRWDYFANAADTVPALSTPWTDYALFGKIYLSGGRGDRQLTDISLPPALPDILFEDVSQPASTLLERTL